MADDERQAKSPASPAGASCPLPIDDYPQVLLAHGGGGKLMNQLLDQLVIPALDQPAADPRHDGAVLELGGARLAFTTDSFVISPLFFPGGDIGALAVNGTVNDLAMCGARPLALSLALIIEEGLPTALLWRVMRSLRDAARAAEVEVVTGDTKVVDRGKGDQLFINTAGVGLIEHGLTIGPAAVAPGDALLLSGDIGRHGLAVMATREGLELETALTSDCAPLAAPVLALLREGIEPHCLRDLTRGGLATALVEIADSANIAVELEEQAIPVRQEVRGACEILGLDPLYVANEGRFVAFLPPAQADRAVSVLRQHRPCAGACVVGRVSESRRAGVTLHTAFGARRAIAMVSGEQLPRIC